MTKRTIWARGRDKVHHTLATQVYPRLGYPVSIAPILRRDNVGTVRRSHVRDFELGFRMPARKLSLREFTPYFADYRRGTLYLSRMPLERDASRAFFYMAQREYSDRIATIAIGRLDAIRDAGFTRTAAPLLIFSIGRCGSTLLSNLIMESGVTSFSELGIFDQTAELSGEIGRQLGHGENWIREFRERVLGVTLQALYARSEGPNLCIKMRSGSARVFREILETYPKAESVFLFREVESWAKSWITAFGAKIDVMIRTLNACVCALDFARDTGLPHRVVWYEEILADPVAACGKILGGAARPGGAASEDLRRVMERDSQRDTGLSAENLSRRRAEDAARIAEDTAAFLAAWRAAQPTELLRKNGLTGLIA